MEITIEVITTELSSILKENAPVRGEPFPASVRTERQRINYLKPTKYSPYPGNLKNNGIVPMIQGNSSQIEIGGERAPYADVTELRSMKRGWMEKSNGELIDKLRQAGGIVR